VINERFEKRNILLASNRAPAEWPGLFLNPLLASAGLDRLMDLAEVIIIRGPSFRSLGRTNLLEEVQILNPEP
jgi:DNA replication protein DnaC